MKILLDENLPSKLKANIGADHEVRTVREMGWNGKKNGDLLGSMTLAGFHALITVDKNLSKQQNLSRFPITVFLLKARDNKHETLQEFMVLVAEYCTKPLQTGLIEVSL